MEQTLAGCDFYGRAVSLVHLEQIGQCPVHSFEVVLAFYSAHSCNATTGVVVHHMRKVALGSINLVRGIRQY